MLSDYYLFKDIFIYLIFILFFIILFVQLGVLIYCRNAIYSCNVDIELIIKMHFQKWKNMLYKLKKKYLLRMRVWKSIYLGITI